VEEVQTALQLLLAVAEVQDQWGLPAYMMGQGQAAELVKLVQLLEVACSTLEVVLVEWRLQELLQDTQMG